MIHRHCFLLVDVVLRTGFRSSQRPRLPLLGLKLVPSSAQITACGRWCRCHLTVVFGVELCPISSFEQASMTSRVKKSRSPCNRMRSSKDGKDGKVAKFSPTPKRRRLAPQDPCLETELSSDMLHHIFGFFLASSGKVDGASMMSAMLVSKRWNAVATSRSLWASIHEPTNANTISQTLIIQDVTQSRSSCSDEEFAVAFQPLSLIGFAKLTQRNLGFGDNSMVYRALERCSGRVCRICVSPKNQRSSAVLNHIFEAHFFQGETDFLAPGCDDSVHMKTDYPRGVVIIGFKIVRWYEDGDIPCRLPEPLFGIKSTYNLTSHQMNIVKSRLPHGVSVHSHLRNMEIAQASQPVNDHLCRRSWALVVDWLVEVEFCFGLPYRTTFHAMDLFRRFVSHLQVRSPSD